MAEPSAKGEQLAPAGTTQAGLNDGTPFFQSVTALEALAAHQAQVSLNGEPDRKQKQLKAAADSLGYQLPAAGRRAHLKLAIGNGVIHSLARTSGEEAAGSQNFPVTSVTRKSTTLKA